jgi:hypothetical protein
VEAVWSEAFSIGGVVRIPPQRPTPGSLGLAVVGSQGRPGKMPLADGST